MDQPTHWAEKRAQMPGVDNFDGGRGHAHGKKHHGNHRNHPHSHSHPHHAGHNADVYRVDHEACSCGSRWCAIVRVPIFPIIVCVRSAYVIGAGVGFRVESGAVALLQLVVITA